jgi:hypothetical protein
MKVALYVLLAASFGSSALAEAADNVCPLTSRVETKIQAYDDVVTEARRCSAGDACVIAGGVRGCRCAVAVRASAKQRVDSAAKEAACEQVERLYCPPLSNPRCEKSVCIATPAVEQ